MDPTTQYFLMENNFSWFSILFSFTLSIFFILKVGKRFKNDKIFSNLPPGPWKLPIIGSTHHLIGSLPHHRMRELSQKFGPLMHLQLGELSAIVISSKEVAKEVLRTNEVAFSQRPHFLDAEIINYGCTNIVFSPYGDYWKQLRKICTLELLSAKRVRSFQSIRKKEVSNLVEYISINNGSTINLTHQFLSMIYNIVSKVAFGDQCSKDREAYILFIKECMRSSGSFSVTTLFPSQHWLRVICGTLHKLNRLHKSGDTVLENIINKATTNTRGDENLLSYLLNLKDDSSPDFDGFHLTTTNIKAVLQDVLIGGSETTSTTMEWAFAEMLKNPRVMKLAQEEVRQTFGSRGYIDETDLEELKYLKAVIKETLRLHPPGPLLFPRECIETCEISGYTIPAGTHVYVNAWAIGRDQKYWIDGEKFYPERFMDSPIDYKGSSFEFLPFSAGKRMCPGILFAEPNIQLPLAQLLYYFDWKFPSGTSHENFDMTEVFGTIVKRKCDLCVIPIPHYPE